MKKKIVSLILTFATCISLVSCSAKQNELSPTADTKYSDHLITKQQMLDDYDAMWTAMEENYPFWNALDRLGYPDYTTVRAQYRKELEEMEQDGDYTMTAFLEVIANSLYDVCGTVGHVSIVNSNSFRDLDVYRNHLSEMPELQPWVDVIQQPEVIAFYEYFDYLDSLETDEQQETDTPEETEAAQEAELSRLKERNLTTQILSEGKTAYINIESFDDAFIEGDLPKISAFLEQVQDYEHLIIDIQNNGGGNSTYWEDAFVKPNIAEPITVSDVRLIGNGVLAQKFYYDMDYETLKLSLDDIKSNPDFTALHLDDLDTLTFAKTMPYTYEPDTSEALFKGKIWVLASSSVYSAAEGFAVFCKQTGFATIVGKTTGGSNSGGAILFELPNSHCLVEFDVEYCLNPDGSCSQEIGTTPDIETDNALHTVLDLIDTSNTDVY